MTMTVPVVRFTIAGQEASHGLGRPYTCVYDGTCKVCTRLANVLHKWAHNDQVEVVPSQASGVMARFPWIPAHAYAEALQLVGPNGRTWQGAAAIEQIVQQRALLVRAHHRLGPEEAGPRTVPGAARGGDGGRLQVHGDRLVAFSAIQVLAQILPFHWMIGFPVELVLGRLTPVEAATGLAAQAAWLLISLFLLRLIWRAGIRVYSAVGA